MSAAAWKVLFWFAAAIVFVAFLYLVRGILLPFSPPEGSLFPPRPRTFVLLSLRQAPLTRGD